MKRVCVCVCHTAVLLVQADVLNKLRAYLMEDVSLFALSWTNV